MSDQVKNAYYCDGKNPKCADKPFSTCYKRGGDCMHTNDIFHRRKICINGIEIPTKMIEASPNVYFETLTSDIESVIFAITEDV